MTIEQNFGNKGPEPTATLSVSDREREAAAPLPQLATPSAMPVTEQPLSFGVAARLYRMADRYMDQNAIRQATEIYFELVEEFADTPSAPLARERLLDIGEHYERNGEFHLARGIYERLSCQE